MLLDQTQTRESNVSELSALISQLKRQDSIERLRRIGKTVGPLVAHAPGPAETFSPFEDAGAMSIGDGFTLIAEDGWLDRLEESDGRVAGRRAAYACATRIAATGGLPEGVTIQLACRDEALTLEIMTGVFEACAALSIPLLGSQIEPETLHTALAMTLFGRGKKLLRSNAARPGDVLVAAVDIRGKRTGKTTFNWEPPPDRPSGSIVRDLVIPIRLNDRGLLRSGRSASGIGIVAAACLLAEYSGAGCRIRPADFPRPRDLDVAAWTLALPDFAFVFSVHSADLDEVTDAFRERQISCEAIGEISIGRVVELEMDGESRPVFDLRKEPFLGPHK
jgi:uncharacterized protein